MDNEQNNECKSLETIYDQFDREVDAFTDVASLSCPFGCGDCCDHADTEVTRSEARLISQYIRKHRHELEMHVDRHVSSSETVACVFYDPELDFHCRIYPARPLICRAFGYSAYSDRSGNKLFAICPSMPIAKSSGSAMQVLFEPYPPVVEHYKEKIEGLAEKHALTRGRRPLARAVFDALREETNETHER